ncbi:hypothetical protein R50072_31330 [Simiduia litorea]
MLTQQQKIRLIDLDPWVKVGKTGSFQYTSAPLGLTRLEHRVQLETFMAPILQQAACLRWRS